MASTRKNPTKNNSAFIEAARALECDESEERFDAALKKIAAHKPPLEKADLHKRPQKDDDK